MKKDIIREPVELIDEDLDVIAGGGGLDLSIDTNVNVAVVDQLIVQIQALAANVVSSATTSAAVSQIA